MKTESTAKLTLGDRVTYRNINLRDYTGTIWAVESIGEVVRVRWDRFPALTTREMASELMMLP